MKDLEVEADRSLGDFEETYRLHAARLWRALYAFAGDRDVASDALAEAFAQGIARGSAVRSPTAWVWRASFRIAAGQLKARASYLALTEEHDRAVAPERADESLSLLAALKQLSPKARASVVLFHVAGYPVQDVARLAGSTPAAVRVHLRRGRAKLKRLLEEEEET